MFKSSNLLQQIANKIINIHHFRNILRKQNQIFLLDSLQLENCPPEYILKIYSILPSRSKTSTQSTSSLNRWFQYEKKIFAWFIICYTHFLKEDVCEPLVKMYLKQNEDFWVSISPIFFHKLPQFLHFQYLNLLRPTERIIWENKEDQLLLKCLETEKEGKWSQISRQMFYLSKYQVFKSPKNCRERWYNHLDTSKNKGKWTLQQDLFIIRFVVENGRKWSKLTAKMMNSRTENMVKNRFNSIVLKFPMNKREKEADFFQRVLTMYENKISETQEKISNIISNQQNKKVQNCLSLANSSQSLIKTNQYKEIVSSVEPSYQIQNRSNWNDLLNANFSSKSYLNSTQYINNYNIYQNDFQRLVESQAYLYFVYPIIPNYSSII